MEAINLSVDVSGDLLHNLWIFHLNLTLLGALRASVLNKISSPKYIVQDGLFLFNKHCFVCDEIPWSIYY